MDRDRLIEELSSRGLTTEEGILTIVEELGRGGNGVAFLCSGDTTGELVAKVYIPPDKRDRSRRPVARPVPERGGACLDESASVRIAAIGSGTTQIGAYVRP